MTKQTAKTFALTSLLLALATAMLLCFVGCGKYKEQAGIYSLTLLERNGINMLWAYDYYRLEISANGKCTETFQRVGGSPNMQQTKVTFSDGKMIAQSDGSEEIVFDYEAGKLTYEYQEIVDGATVYVKMVFEKI